MKKTKWFPAHIKPVHIGVYNVWWYTNVKSEFFAYWDGNCWGFMYASKEFAVFRYKENKNDRHAALCWRGLAKKP